MDELSLEITGDLEENSVNETMEAEAKLLWSDPEIQN